MNEFSRDIFIGLLFVIGMWSFISGQFVVSAALFGVASVFTNIVMRVKIGKQI